MAVSVNKSRAKTPENLELSSLSVKDVYLKFSSTKSGLSTKEADRRLDIYGKNSFGETKKKSRIAVFLKNFQSSLIYILLLASLIAFLMGELTNAAVIFLITLVNAFIGYFQEQKAESALEVLRKMTRLNSVVVRDSKRTNIKSDFLVPGDIVVLAEGDKIPADGRIIESSEFLINEAVLTGESFPVKKNSQPFVVTNVGEEPTNLVFMGTTVIGGHAMMIVTKTGITTEFGKISKLVEHESQTIAPLQKKMAKFSKSLGLLVTLICLAIFITGTLMGRGLVAMLELAISMAVSAIPEGLPVAITVILVMGIKRMAKHKAILRNLAAVETLGTTTVIASDKTGTITHNKLTVTKIYTDKVYRLSGEGHGFKGDFLDGEVRITPGEHIIQLLRAGIIVNNGKLEKKNQRTEIFGDPTDCAILVAARKADISKEERDVTVTRLAEMPFSSERKYQAVLAKTRDVKRIYMKGALEEILKRCDSYFEKGFSTKMDNAQKDEIKKQAKYFADRGLRIIAIAYKKGSVLSEDSLRTGFTFMGLMGMRDTYRSGVREAIKKCKNAGIRMIMITGDHLDTAKAIGQDIGILKDESEAIEAGSLESMSLSEVKKAIKRVSVFARISPIAKYKIIEALKADGEIVAMTGDGVNDVPALRKADIGVVMGVMGTEAAKDASDMVLTDDNFSTIVFAVSEGRAVFSNIRKTIFYLLSTNLGEVCTVVTGLLLGYPLVLLPIQILWVNLVTDSLTAIPLGMEPAHTDQLSRKPRDPKEPLVTKRMLMKMLLTASVMAIGSILIFRHSLPHGVVYARTMVFNYLVFIQWLNVFNARTETSSIFSKSPFSNKPLIIGLLSAITLQIVIQYTTILEHVFELSTLTLSDWGLIGSIALLAVVVSEVEKFIHRKRNK